MSRQRLDSDPRPSLICNLAYGLYTGIWGLIDHSYWFFALAAYYIVLSVMRFAVLLAVQKTLPETERFISRFIGWMFLFLSLTLAAITWLSFLNDRGTKYHEIVMISIALYTFIKITFAFVRLVQAKKSRSVPLKVLRNICLADALVSIFSLQRSMLVTFQGMDAGAVRLMNSITGTAIYILVAFLGIHMIGGKTYIMAKSKLVKANEKIAEAVTDGYKKIEQGVVEGYSKIEHGVVEGYTKIEDQFISRFLTKDGETVEEARARLKGEEK